MALLKTLKFILNHPLTTYNKLPTLLRYAKWQAYFRLVPYPILYPFIGNTKLLAYKGLTGTVFNIYTGLHEFEDMAFMLHVLREDDIFIDIGANIGTYTVLAAGVVGCRTMAVEPVPSTFAMLRQHVYLNQLDSLVELHNVGLGSEESVLKFTNSLDTINHVATAEETDVIEVKIKRLDDLTNRMPVLMKIDVEGFEKEVLHGSDRILGDQKLQAVIIELNGSGKRYGYDDEDIHQHLLKLGFNPFGYEPFSRSLEPLSTYNTHNTIYIRDIEFVKQRVQAGEKIQVLNRQI